MSEKIKISAIRKSAEGSPISLTPVFDQDRNTFPVGNKEYKAREIRDHTGKTVSRQTMEDCPVLLCSDRARTYSHGDEFLKDSAADMIWLQILIDQGFLPAENERANPNQHRFMRIDKIRDARAAVDRGTLVSKALTIVSEMNSADMSGIAFVEKQPVRQMSALEIQGFVYKLASERPSRVIELTSDRNFKVRAFLQRLIDFGIFTKNSSGIKLGQDVIGLDDDQAVEWLTRPDNSERVQLLNKQLISAAKGSEASIIGVSSKEEKTKEKE